MTSLPLVALCPGPTGLTGLALDADARIDAARPCRLNAGFDPGPGTAYLLVDDNVPGLLQALFGRSDALPIQSLPPSPSVLCPASDLSALRLSIIAGTVKVAAVDRRRAFILGLLALPEIMRRSLRHGLALLWLDERRVRVALVFRAALHAMADLSLPVLLDAGGKNDLEPMLRLLNDFCLGWLPAEEAARYDGTAWRAANLPDEAEGFKPLIATGPMAGLLAGRARIMTESPEVILCRGLLHAARLTQCKP